MREPFPGPAGNDLDGMLVDVDTALFGLRMKLAALVATLLADVPGRTHDVDADFARWSDDGCRPCRCLGIAMDDGGAIMLSVAGEEAPLDWEDLDVAAQYRVAQGLHARRYAGGLYRSLS